MEKISNGSSAPPEGSPREDARAVTAWLGSRLLSGLRFVALAAFLGLASMAVSFLVVHQLTERMKDGGPLDPLALQRARILRAFSNELVGLCNVYQQRVSDGLSPSDRMWLDRSFRPDLQFLEQRMDDTMPGDAVACVQLRAAASRCAAMARNPEDTVLRTRTLDEVVQAVAEVESYIAQLDIGGRAGPPHSGIHFD